MTNYSTTGYLTDAGRTIKFTIALDLPVVNAEIALSELNVEIRQHDNNTLILSEDVILDTTISVLTEVQDVGIFVTLSKSTMFVEANNMPVSVLIVSADGTFYDDEDGKFVSVIMQNNYVKSMKSCLPGTSADIYELPANLVSATIGCYQISTSDELVLDSTQYSTVVQVADNNNIEIVTLKKDLRDTDYVVVKTMEAIIKNPPASYSAFRTAMTGAYSDNQVTIEDRIQWRTEIESLQPSN